MEKIWGILICFLIGGLLQHFWKRAANFREVINKYLIYFGLPFLIVISLVSNPTKKLFNYALIIAVLLVLTNIVIFFLVKILRLTPVQKGSIFLCSTYGNWIYLGIPLAYALFGSVGLILASVAGLIKGIFHFSLGIYLSNLYTKNGSTAIKRVFKTPLIYGFLIAFLLAQFPLRIPDFLLWGASSAIYLAALVIGLSLSFERFEKSLIWGAVFKFGVWPILTLLFLLFLDLSSLEKKILLFLAFIPPAIVNTNLCLEYNLDYKFASNFITLSTVGFLIIVFLLKIFS